MTVQLLMLKSGEDIIADVKEMTVSVEGKDRVVGYYLTFPHRVKLIAPRETEGETNVRTGLHMIPWVPLSKDKTIPIVADWIVSAIEPLDAVKELFLKRLEEVNESQAASDAEQSYLVDPD